MTAEALYPNERLFDRVRGMLHLVSDEPRATGSAPAAAGTWRALRPATKIYVAAVAGFGAAAIALSIPMLGESASGVFTTLAILSLITAFAKVNVPVSGGDSTFTVCYVIDFTALLLLGIPYATLTTAAGVWTQCTFKCRGQSQLHQTWFSIGALAVTVHVAGLVFHTLGGQTGSPNLITHPAALGVAAAAYFVTNSMLIAAAVAMSSRQSISRVWWSSYAPMWRDYGVGCSIAAIAAASIAHSTLWLVPLAFSIVALTRRNLKAYAEGLNDSNTDALTGLPNRRALASRATQELARAERAHTPVAVLVVDLNRFKSINDTCGHRAGDAALQEVARRLQASLRTYDICARYGGDEFVLILPGCGREDMMQKAQVLERAVEESGCELKPSVRTRLTVSVGGAVFPDDGRGFDELFATADRKMYERKRSSREAASTTSASAATPGTVFARGRSALA